MSEQEIRRLEGYDLKSITRANDCDCYDVVLTPRPQPEVRLRIREEDLARLAAAVTSNEDGVWELDMDCGSLYDVAKGSEEAPRFGFSNGIRSLVAVEVYGEATHFYGCRSEEQDGDE